MKKFLKNTTIFVLLIFGLGVLLWFRNGDQINKNTVLNQKQAFLDKHPEFNTVFIGSSKINNQINPQIIDALNPGLKTYNLGANASFNLENNSTIDFLLHNQNRRLKYIVLELQNKIDLTRTNLNTERSFGALTPQNFPFFLSYQKENKDYKQLAFGLYSTVLSIFNFNKEKTTMEESYLNQFIEKDGFIPLDKDKNSAVLQRNKDLLAKPSEITRRLTVFNNDQTVYVPNQNLEKKWLELSNQCKDKGIQLVLLLPAPAEPDAKELLVYTQSNEIPVINMLNPAETPEFYQLENRWDYGHLNEKGANLLSEKIGKAMQSLKK